MEENARMDLGNSGRYTQNLEFLARDLPFDGFHVKNGGSMNENQKNSNFVSENGSKVLSDRGSNLSKYKLMSPARLPISRSSCLPIPPGLSPTTLLDSPVLLSNLKAEPSPTTGTFCMPPKPHDSRTSPGDRSNVTRIDDESNAIKINPHIKLSLGSGLSSLGPTASVSSYNQCKPSLQVQQSFQFETNPSISSHEFVPNLNLTDHTDTSCDKVTTDNLVHKVESDDGIQVLQSDQKAISVVAKSELSLEDGYNWRKYGQKLVKGSEFPRSYYKCTHPNCQVKKQMERSFDGHITEIIYKGKHDHPRPPANRRMATGVMFSSQEEDRCDGFCSLVGEEDRLTISHSKESRNEANGNLTLSPVSASDEELEGSCPQTNKDSETLDDGDNSESKRRKTDLSSMDANLMAKSNREQRVVVQTVSEVDILDDGYRWRKYGQKVVKGNPNPRSYYKCTNTGCPVRKHVERASHDPKAVITTYEGKHNHDVPSLRNGTLEPSQPTTINSLNGSRIQSSTSMNGAIRIDDSTCTFPHLCELSKEKQPISLQLGVGVNVTRGPEDQPIEDGERNNGSICQQVVQATSILPYYGILGNNILPRHASRDQVEGFGFRTTPINHPSSNQISKERYWAIANGFLME